MEPKRLIYQLLKPILASVDGAIFSVDIHSFFVWIHSFFVDGAIKKLGVF
jgi:hypothetical protein